MQVATVEMDMGGVNEGDLAKGLVYGTFVVILGLALFILIALICILWGSLDAVPRTPSSLGTTICHTLKPVV